MLLQRQPDHLKAVVRRGDVIPGLMGRASEGNVADLLQAESLAHFLGRPQVPIVNGIKSPP
jgi:hypothetical protein